MHKISITRDVTVTGIGKHLRTKSTINFATSKSKVCALGNIKKSGDFVVAVAGLTGS